MTRLRFLGLVGMVGLVLGLSSCGSVADEPVAADTGVEIQRTYGPSAVFVSTLEFSSGKCADVPRYTKRVGADLIQYDCNDQKNQLFLFNRVSDEFDYTVKGLASGLCMSVSPTETFGGNPVVEQTACTGAPNQQFGIIFVSVEDVGIFGIEAGRDSNRCLSVNNRSGQNRAPLVAVKCDENGNSPNGSYRWSLQNYSPAFATEMIDSRSSKCADVPRFSKRVGTDLIVYTCNGQTNQQFEFLKVSEDGSKDIIVDDAHLIRSVSSGLCITLSEPNEYPLLDFGVPLEQRECTGAANQRFGVSPSSDGETQIEIVGGDTCLGVDPIPMFTEDVEPLPSGIPQNRDNLVTYPCISDEGDPRWTLPGAVGNFGGLP